MRRFSVIRLFNYRPGIRECDAKDKGEKVGVTNVSGTLLFFITREQEQDIQTLKAEVDRLKSMVRINLLWRFRRQGRRRCCCGLGV